MKKNRLLVTFALFILFSVYNLTAQSPAMSITVLDTYGNNLKEDTLTRFNTAIIQHLKASNKFTLKARDQLDKVLRMMDIRKDDRLDDKQAADVGGKMGSQLVVLSSGSYANGFYSLEIKVLKSITGTIYAEVRNEFRDIKEIEKSLPSMVDYLVDETLLIDSYFARNYLFFTESEALFNKKTTRNPSLNMQGGVSNTTAAVSASDIFAKSNDPRNFFAIYRLGLSLQGAYNQPVGNAYGHVLPAAFCSITADYALYTTDYFVISPLVELNYSVYDISSVLINDIDLVPMPVLGVVAGCNFTLTLPMLRMLSFHLKPGAGFTISYVRLEDAEEGAVSNDFLLNLALESRLTLLQKFSLSLVANYSVIFFESNFLIQDIKLGGGLGYRF